MLHARLCLIGFWSSCCFAGDGSGGDSIYGGQFNDEKPGLKFKVRHLPVVRF